MSMEEFRLWRLIVEENEKKLLVGDDLQFFCESGLILTMRELILRMLRSKGVSDLRYINMKLLFLNRSNLIVIIHAKGIANQ